MNTTETQSRRSLKRLVRRLDAAHTKLVDARKIAALYKHESYEDIGDAIECVEAAFVWLHKSPNDKVSDGGPLTHESPAAQSHRSLH